MNYLPAFKIYPEAQLPVRGTESSACLDVHTCLKIDNDNLLDVKGYSEMNDPIIHPYDTSDNLFIRPGTTALLPTGLILDIPRGHSVRVFLRSSIGLKRGLIQPHSVGVVDEDYIDPLFVLVRNVSQNNVSITHGERIAQIELFETIPTQVNEIMVKPKQKTDRVGGLGSTGK